MSMIIYPATPRIDALEAHFGQTVSDPYRWLENDIRSDDKVASWVAAQNRVTDAYLNTLPGRALFKRRLKQLYDYERFTIPVRKGGRYFYRRQSGDQNQLVLYVRDGADGEGRVLIDPNGWSNDGATALAEWAASDNGRYLAYAVQQSGSDWRTIQVLNVDTGQVLADEVKWARFTTLAWASDGSGFFYNRFPEPVPGAVFQAGVENHAIYFHALGTPQAQDRRVHATPDQPALLHPFKIAKDGRYLVITSTPAGRGGPAQRRLGGAHAGRQLRRSMECHRQCGDDAVSDDDPGRAALQTGDDGHRRRRSGRR
jgi:prolyl oligopeptidase